MQPLFLCLCAFSSVGFNRDKYSTRCRKYHPSTTLYCLQMLVPSHMPIPLANEACPNKDLPSYVHVRACGFRIYAKMMQLQEVAVCPYVSVYGLFVMHNDAFSIFSCSRLPISCGLLVNAFFNNATDQIAVVVYNEGQSFLDVVGHLPFSHDQDVCRRFDVGVNKHTDKIPLFRSLTNGAKINLRRFTQCVVTLVREEEHQQMIFDQSQAAVYPLIGCKPKNQTISQHNTTHHLPTCRVQEKELKD